MKSAGKCLFYAALAVLSASAVSAESNWPDWRGPNGDGHANAEDLPLTWSESENIAWKVPIHGRGYSTPVVWGDQIWLTTATEDGKELYAVCVSLKNGEILRDILVFQPAEPQRIHPNNTYATPSAAVEENRVYVHYGTHGTAALDTRTGEVLWRQTDLNCEHMQGPVSSPFLYGDLLILHLEGTDVQFITALNKNTGETVWRVDRPADLYGREKTPAFRKSYQTPILAEVDGKTQLISNGALLATGLDPETGSEIWRVRYGTDNTIARVVSGLGLFFVNCGGPPNRAQLWAVRQGGEGDVTDTHVVWKMTDDVPLESSPLLAGERLYTVSDNGILLCANALTGETVWRERLRERHGASPLYAADRIYFFGKKGTATVIEPGDEYRELAVNQLDGGFWASPAVAGNTLILRTETHLYRVMDAQAAER